MSRERKTVELAVTFKAATDLAYLVYDHASDKEVWIPVSQVEETHKPKGYPCDGTIVMTEWIARTKGLME